MTTYNYCVDCGTFIEPDDKFCKNCGYLTNLNEITSDKRYHCPRCANPLASDYKYCPTCGSRTEIPGTVRHLSEAQKKSMTTEEINKITDVLEKRKRHREGKELPPEKNGIRMGY